MTKRERVIAAIQGDEVDAVPSGFSMHFPKEKTTGEAGIQAHLDFFRDTDTDILKIMNENLVPDVGEIRTPDDWNRIPACSLKTPFIQRQIDLTKRILDKCDGSAFTLGTLHGICASAIHPLEQRYGYIPVRELQVAHLRENPKPVLEAFKRITEGMCILARAYVELGVNGIYYAGLGAEYRFFTDEEFGKWIAPFDREILAASKEAGGYNFLHMCKDKLNLARYAGDGYMESTDVVNWGIYEAPLSLEEGRKLFKGKCVMGGLANRSGVLVDGTKEKLAKAVKDVIRGYGTKKFILGADCTLPTEISTDRIRAAVNAAR